jgi:hypothetical protein
MDKGGVYGVSTYEQPTKKAMDVYAAFRACYPRHGSYLAVGVDWAGDKIHLIIRHTQDNCVLFDKVLDKKGVQTDPDLHNVIDVALGVDQLDYAQYPWRHQLRGDKQVWDVIDENVPYKHRYSPPQPKPPK